MNALYINSLATDQENWFLFGYRRCRACDIKVRKTERDFHVHTRQHVAAVLKRIKETKTCSGCIVQLHPTSQHFNVCAGCNWPERAQECPECGERLITRGPRKLRILHVLTRSAGIIHF
ncbi:MAG TPA: hypothetical protein VKM55_30815 [Candidatus Lokiarchaeia archaeon]|nr:hypothetical protein [Candidatus Lokiarchaeia archaeon]